MRVLLLGMRVVRSTAVQCIVVKRTELLGSGSPVQVALVRIEWWHSVGVAVYALYQVIMFILMLNVLISIMNSTYMHSCEMSRV